MEIFWRLLLAHLLADFTFQTDSLVRWKKESALGVIFHSMVFLVAAHIVCWNILGEEWAAVGFSVYGWFAVGFISACHFLIDLWKINVSNGSHERDNLFYFSVDQVMHLFFIFLFFKPSEYLNFAPYKIWIIAVILVLLSHFMTVLLYYIKKSFYSLERFVHKEKKYVLIADRLVVGLAFLLTGWWWIAIVCFWIFHTLYMRFRKKVDYDWSEIIVGYLFTVILGYFARIVYFS